MKVEFLVKNNKKNELVLRLLFLNDEYNSYSKKVVESYIKILKKAYQVDRIKKESRDNHSVYLLTLAYRDTFGLDLTDEHSILSFVCYLGFVTPNSIEALGELETNRLKSLCNENIEEMARNKKIKRTKSRKIFISNRRMNTLRNNMIFVRTEVESLYYTEGKLQHSYAQHLEELDFILENYRFFVSNLGLCQRVDKKILKKMLFYQQYASNMKHQV